VTQFDLIVAALLVISAGVGFLRGAIREVAALVALVGAAFVAIYGLPIATPLVLHLIHTRWLAATIALVGLFAVVYVALRLIGAGIARNVQRTHVLGTLDRVVGLGIGVARGLVVMGGLYLMFNAATPEDLRPHWITGSLTWPVSRSMGELITDVAPNGLGLAGRVRPAFDKAMHGAMQGRSGDRNASGGYDARQRGEIDDLVEKSR
jgi:membrane protein required for colicin V production